MNNDEFLNLIRQAYLKYLDTHRRSNEKLKVLHGAIAMHLQQILGPEFEIFALGMGANKEVQLAGRYFDKKVDIGICHKKSKRRVAGIAVKFVMSNYSQNSNNYFESMLGETANIRSGQNAYFQIVILPQKMPYFDKDDRVTKWETVTEHNLQKYMKLSQDDVLTSIHTPNKTLVCLLDIKQFASPESTTRAHLINQLKQELDVKMSPMDCHFGSAVICNDYGLFVEKIVHFIKSI
ncbi:MAG: hypothetical protein FWD76_01785 [Firmicutes bacterium]|nr:hypothetical protein [Bacillota bacterium]